MVSKIRISNLKSIDNIELDCKKLNIMTGTNSSGKSTILQALLLFYQTHEGLNIKEVNSGLNGKYINLGEFRENRNYNTKSETIQIDLEFDNYEECIGRIVFEEKDNFICESKTEEFLGTSFDMLFDDTVNENMNNLKYLSCNRIGSQDVYSKNYYLNDIGQNGEYAIDYLEKHKSDILDKSLIKSENANTLSEQVNYWLQYIINATISVEDIPGTDIVKASYAVGERRLVRPKNVGSGISYLISILILCLSSQKDDILIIENPEIHLHPKAQSKVCEFLYFIAKAGIQIFVETHSDHIFNGIRAGIATSDVNTDDVAINFLQLNDQYCTENTVITFGKRGRINNYTEGLFDQFDIDLNKMLGL